MGSSALRAVVAAAAIAVFLVPAASSPASATVPGPAYVTLQFGRTQWVSTKKCAAVPGAVDLGVVAAELQRRGYAGVGAIILDRTSDGSRKCIGNFYLSASWQDIAGLKAMGWSFISAGQDYASMTTRTTDQLYAESCGTLPEFAARGIDASGEFAYPDDKSTTAIQSDVVSACYDWGRQYTQAPQAYRVSTLVGSVAPWFQATHSLNGGLCNDPTRPCYRSAGTAARRYQLPSRMVQWLTGLKGDQWATLQAYRLVTGSHSTAPTWDCTSPNPNAHWTSATELYCWNDYLAVLNKIPSTAVVTDPGTVAGAWGRAVDTTPPTTTIDSGPQSITNAATASFEFSASQPNVRFDCSLDGAAFTSCVPGVSYAGLLDGPHSFSVRGTDITYYVGPVASWSWVVDTTPPSTVIDTGPADPTQDVTATFTFHASESAVTFTCSLDGAPAPPCSPGDVYSSLALGPHSFVVWATDQAGNAGPPSATWTWNVIA